MLTDRKKVSIVVLLFVASLMLVLPTQMVKAQTATISVSPQNNIVTVGQTLTVHIEISNVANLYAVDIALTWDTSMLKLVSNQSFVGVSNGVLNAQVLVVQDTASQQSGEYNLIATSEFPAGPWSGSATVATLTFTVTRSGTSALTLKSSTSNSPELASYVQSGSGDTAEPITAAVINGNVSAAATSTSPSASQSPSSSSSTSSSPSPTPKVPEFPMLAILPLLVAASLILLLPKLRKQAFRRTTSAL